MRTIASLGGYLATSTDDGVQLQQYLPAEVVFEIGAGKVMLGVATDYPRDGRVTVTVTATPDAVWELALRIPTWAGDRATVTVQGRTVPTATDATGYHRIRDRWTDGAIIVVDLPLPVLRVTGGHCSGRRPRLRGHRTRARCLLPRATHRRDRSACPARTRTSPP